MELKKSKNADISNKSALFFSMGLFLSLATTVAVFEHKTMDNVVDLTQNRNTDQMEELLDIPPTEQLPPPPPPVQQPQVIEVPDDVKIDKEIEVNMDAESTEQTKIEEIEIKVDKGEKEEVDEIFSIVEEQASPVGGMNSFYDFIGKNVKYPAQARRYGVEGRVYVSFVVNKDGSLQDVKVIRGIGAGCDEEAVRVLSLSPRWNPAKQRSRPVRSQYHMFIIFSMR